MLGSRIEEMLDAESHNNIVSMVTDEAKQRQLLLEDEDEDFLDEGTLAGATFISHKEPLCLGASN